MCKCNCKSLKTSQRPQKPRQGDQLIHRHYIKAAIAKRFVSVPCQIQEGQAEETAWGYGCIRWWWRRMCRGTGVESGLDSLKSSVFSHEWKVAEESGK